MGTDIDFEGRGLARLLVAGVIEALCARSGIGRLVLTPAPAPGVKAMWEKAFGYVELERAKARPSRRGFNSGF